VSKSKSMSKSSDRSSLYKDARTQPRRIAKAVQTTKLGGQKKAMRGQDSGKTECKKIFSKRILTNREERAEKYGFVTVGCWM
jgi:hypothetical protein